MIKAINPVTNTPETFILVWAFAWHFKAELLIVNITNKRQFDAITETFNNWCISNYGETMENEPEVRWEILDITERSTKVTF